MTDILQYTPIFIGVVIVVFFIYAIATRKKKGDDTPESLADYYSTSVEFMEIVPPFSLIFKKVSNDGTQIIFKELTQSRNCFIKFERNKIILECFDLSNNKTFYGEEGGHYVDIPEDKFYEKFHNLYVNKFANSKSGT